MDIRRKPIDDYGDESFELLDDDDSLEEPADLDLDDLLEDNEDDDDYDDDVIGFFD